MNLVRYVLLSLVIAAPGVWAQNAALHGQVADESGAVIAGATVTLKGEGPARTTESDATGAYSFANVTAGTYTAQAAAPQLTQAKPLKITLKPGSQALNLTLSIASISEKVTVQ